MKPEDVPAEWVDLAEVIYDGGEIAGAMRRALAAVIPLIEARERKACENAAETATLPDGYQWGKDALESFDFGKARAGAAIRARGETQ